LVRLNRPANAEFPDARLEGRALHAQKGGRALGTGDAPFGVFQGAENVLALGLFER
jgi:hypothetical protein